MGTQQILLIVLSVIIVGVAIAVGITMFQNQAYNSNKTAVVGELQQYAAQVIQWYKTPVSQGGAGSDTGFATSVEDIGTYIGFGGTTLTTDTGTYTMAVAAGTAVTGDTKALQITGKGKESKGGKSPQGLTTISFPSCSISTVVTDV